MIVHVRHYYRAILVYYNCAGVIEAYISAFPVSIPSLPVACHRAHNSLHSHPPHCVVVVVCDQNAIVHVHSKCNWAVEERGSALAVDKAVLPVAGQRAHNTTGRDDPDAVVAEVCNNVFAFGSPQNAARVSEARSTKISICEACSAAPSKMPCIAFIRHKTQGVVVLVHTK
jgi:hypothetical protein